jgi:hypothetical protein
MIYDATGQPIQIGNQVLFTPGHYKRPMQLGVGVVKGFTKASILVEYNNGGHLYPHYISRNKYVRNDVCTALVITSGLTLLP